MATLSASHVRTRPALTPAEVMRLVRETPAPRWGHTTGSRLRFAGYVAGSMAAWTVLGLAGTTAFARAVEALAAVVVG
jgi:hypothetical protein